MFRRIVGYLHAQSVQMTMGVEFLFKLLLNFSGSNKEVMGCLVRIKALTLFSAAENDFVVIDDCFIAGEHNNVQLCP